MIRTAHSRAPFETDSTLPAVSNPDLRDALLALHESQDIPQFWSALQSLLRETISYDALIVYLNFLDFASSWKAARILATPNAERPVTWFEHRRQVDMTPQFVLSQPGKLRLYRLSDVITDPGELKKSDFFRQFLAPGGWHHLAVVLFWRGTQVSSEIALRRTAEQGNFTDAEVQLLDELYPHIAKVLNRLLAREEERAHRSCLESFNEHLPFALMFLDWGLRPAFVNQAANVQSANWNFGPEKARAYHARSVFRVPAEIVEACHRLKAGWLETQARQLGNDGPSASLKVPHPKLPGLTATVTLQRDNSCLLAHPGFAIYLENSSATHPPGVPSPTLNLLSPAEREVALLAADGYSSKEVASKIGKAEKTVRSQLTSIYRKLGVAGRVRLAALLH